MVLAIIILNCFETSLGDSVKSIMSGFGAIDRLSLYVYIKSHCLNALFYYKTVYLHCPLRVYAYIPLVSFIA